MYKYTHKVGESWLQCIYLCVNTELHCTGDPVTKWYPTVIHCQSGRSLVLQVLTCPTATSSIHQPVPRQSAQVSGTCKFSLAQLPQAVLPACPQTMSAQVQNLCCRKSDQVWSPLYQSFNCTGEPQGSCLCGSTGQERSGRACVLLLYPSSKLQCYTQANPTSDWLEMMSFALWLVKSPWKFIQESYNNP